MSLEDKFLVIKLYIFTQKNFTISMTIKNTMLYNSNLVNFNTSHFFYTFSCVFLPIYTPCDRLSNPKEHSFTLTYPKISMKAHVKICEKKTCDMVKLTGSEINNIVFLVAEIFVKIINNHWKYVFKTHPILMFSMG